MKRRRLVDDEGGPWTVVKILAVVLVCGIVIVYGIPLLLPQPTGPVLQETVRVERVVGGHRTKWQRARYQTQVRFASGDVTVVTLRDLYSPGAELRLQYTRTTAGGYLVHGHVPHAPAKDADPRR